MILYVLNFYILINILRTRQYTLESHLALPVMLLLLDLIGHNSDLQRQRDLFSSASIPVFVFTWLELLGKSCISSHSTCWAGCPGDQVCQCIWFTWSKQSDWTDQNNQICVLSHPLPSPLPKYRSAPKVTSSQRIQQKEYVSLESKFFLTYQFLFIVHIWQPPLFFFCSFLSHNDHAIHFVIDCTMLIPNCVVWICWEIYMEW